MGRKSFPARTPATDMLRARRAWKAGRGRFTVISRDASRRYTVLVWGDSSTACNCQAGVYGRACWHQVAVLRRLLRETKRGAAA